MRRHKDLKCLMSRNFVGDKCGISGDFRAGFPDQ